MGLRKNECWRQNRFGTFRGCAFYLLFCVSLCLFVCILKALVCILFDWFLRRFYLILKAVVCILKAVPVLACTVKIGVLVQHSTLELTPHCQIKHIRKNRGVLIWSIYVSTPEHPNFNSVRYMLAPESIWDFSWLRFFITFFELFVLFLDLCIVLCLVLSNISPELNTGRSGETVSAFRYSP